jgi:uncharacterized BrkB/YihY/UPF0761 family membrane protein
MIDLIIVIVVYIVSLLIARWLIIKATEMQNGKVDSGDVALMVIPIINSILVIVMIMYHLFNIVSNKKNKIGKWFRGIK